MYGVLSSVRVWVGSVLESQGLDLLDSLQGVDVLVTSHDHRPFVKEKDGTWLINGGARAGKDGFVGVEFHVLVIV